MRWLPQLGCVLYVPARHAAEQVAYPGDSTLVAGIELAPLLQVGRVGVACAVTEDGPREWVEAVDADGAPVARIYLLPDSDYLMWDAMLDEGLASTSATLSPRTRAFRGAAAQALAFRRRPLGNLQWLDAVVPARLSALGRTVARAIIHGEGARLAGTLA